MASRPQPERPAGSFVGTGATVLSDTPPVQTEDVELGLVSLNPSRARA
jgi:hypothetical protein